MSAVEHFSNVQLVFAGTTFSLFRGAQLSDGQVVLFKTFNAKNPRLSDIQFLEQDSAIAERLDHGVALRPLQVLRSEEQLFAVFEHFAGVPLKHIIRENNSLYLDPPKAIQAMIGMVQALGTLHHHKLIHRCLNPASILLDLATNTVRLTGFGLASFATADKAEPSAEHYELEDMLFYISPEQTGRMNAGVDQRSDIYALGIAFFECLTRRLPFHFSDTLGLIHSHIAQEPPLIRSLNPAVPEPLAAVVHKMMAKNVRDRYQSTRGLLADLEQCRSLLEREHAAELFDLGRADIPDVLHLPEHSFGQDATLKQLTGFFEKEAGGQMRSVFISGPSGVGKSTLVFEARGVSANRNFTFLTGTYKNDSRNVPFSAIAGAFSDMVEQILSAPQAEMLVWRKRLQAAIGDLGGLITDIIPGLEVLLGKQAAVAGKVTPEEADNRLKTAMLSFLQALCAGDQLVVLFLDDLHLTDTRSAAFLRTILQNQHALKNLLLIGAYVDDLVSENQDFETIAQEYFYSQQAQHIEVKPLEQADVQQLLAEVLHQEAPNIAALAELIHAKTKGIPIFAHEFLLRANREGALFFNYQENCWQWDLAAIRLLPISDNVADLMHSKVQQLSPAALDLLKYAACIGAGFDLHTLAFLAGQTVDATNKKLTEAVLAGYVETTRLFGYRSNAAAGTVMHYQFVHDRLHQAVYRLVDQTVRERTHYAIAQHLLNSPPPKDPADYLYQLANHLHAGISTAREKGLEVGGIEALFLAGKKAKMSASYPLALSYLSDADSLMPLEYRAANPDLSFDLGLELLECAYLAGAAKRAGQIFDQLLERAATKIDRARVYQVKAMAYLHLSDFAGCYQTGQEALAIFGIRLPKSPSQGHVLWELIKTRWALRGKSFDDILALPNNNDPAATLIEMIYYRSLSQAMSTSNELYTIISLRMLRLILRHGLSSIAYSSLSLYGMVLTLGFGQYRRGYAFIELCLKVAQKSKSLHAIGGAHFGLAMGGVHTQPLADCIQHYEAAHKYNHRAGSIFYASTCTSSLVLYYLALGRPLSFVREKAQYFQQYARNANQPNTDQFLVHCLYLIDLLTGQSVEPLPDPAEQMKLYPDLSEIHSGWYYTAWMKCCYLLGDYQKGLEAAEHGEKFIVAIYFDAAFVDFHYYKTLLQVQLYKSAAPARRRTFLREIKKAVRILKKRAKNCPENYRHKYLTLQGLLYWIQEKPEKALFTLQEAGQKLSQEEFINDRAIQQELCGQLWLKAGQVQKARSCFEAAAQFLNDWGAGAARANLMSRYAEVFPAQPAGDSQIARPTGNIDFKSVLKASQVLSSEIELTKVLTNLIRIVIENAGAQRGYLLIEKEEEWVVEAAGQIGQEEVEVQRETPIRERSGELSIAIVNYVARTRKAIVVDDAVLDNRFAQDPYILEKQPRSVACHPIINQGKLIGILYLENNLTPGAFTPDREEVLNMLSSQAGISLENAFLYARMTKLNQAYERFIPQEFLRFLGKKSITEVDLGDHVQREMTVMFADIRKFTSMSEQMSPKENFEFINDYLGVMEPIIRRYHGFIDKYIGDGIMALFPTSADDALQAAQEMILQLDDFNASRQLDVRVGIGLNTGMLILGTVGGKDRMDSTVISDAVNLAARVEAMTKRYGVNLLISGNTYTRLQDAGQYPLRLLDQVVAEGRTERVAIYEVLAGESAECMALKLASREEFERALAAWLAGDKATAEDLFRKIVAENVGDMPAWRFLEAPSI